MVVEFPQSVGQADLVPPALNFFDTKIRMDYNKIVIFPITYSNFTKEDGYEEKLRRGRW